MKFEVTLPSWAEAQIKGLPPKIKSLKDRMEVVIEFATRNFQENTGGPFAAGIFEVSCSSTTTGKGVKQKQWK